MLTLKIAADDRNPISTWIGGVRSASLLWYFDYDPKADGDAIDQAVSQKPGYIGKAATGMGQWSVHLGRDEWPLIEDAGVDAQAIVIEMWVDGPEGGERKLVIAPSRSAFLMGSDGKTVDRLT